MAFTPDIVLYHDPCEDGFASVFVAHQRFPAAETVGTNYGHPLPLDKVKGKAVLIVDFSYPMDVLTGMAAHCNGVVVLDHHKTAADQLKLAPKIDNTTAHDLVIEPGQIGVWFDMERSGVGLTWAFCYPGRDMPPVLAAIEDRDLWRFSIEDTEEICAAVRSWPKDFAVWERELLSAAPAKLIADGVAILRYQGQLVNQIASYAHFRDWPADWAGVPVVNCPPQLSSEVGHRLLTLYPSAPFVATYVEGDGIRTWSLRSEDKRFDASIIARKFGGGGHRNACGFIALT